VPWQHICWWEYSTHISTINFTLPLQNGLYLEVVCPLDHPFSESALLDMAPSQRAEEGSG